MKILVINYEMDQNSGVLAWQAEIAVKIAKRCERVAVVTLHMGNFVSASNMQVIELNKILDGKLDKFGGIWLYNLQLLKIITKERPDICFFHMAAEWAWYFFPVLKLFNIPIVVWYAHGAVAKHLKKVVKIADRIITSTPEGFRISSPKVRIIGQGINTEIFKIPILRERELKKDILYIGRVSSRKRIDLLIYVLKEINARSQDGPFRLRILGPILTIEDIKYDREIRNKVFEMGLENFVDFIGFIPQRYIPKFYNTAFLHLNLSETKSMDKTVLEAFSCGCPALTNNEAFKKFLSRYEDFFIESKDPASIAERVLDIYKKRNSYSPEMLRGLVYGKHDQDTHVEKIFSQFKEII